MSRGGTLLIRWFVASTVVLSAVVACGTGGSPASGAAPPARPSTPSTAADVYQKFVTAGLPVSGLIVYTAATDPNNLLGRPNGYTSKCAWVDSRVPTTDTNGLTPGDVSLGGSVEVFPTPAGATARAAYLVSLYKAAPILGTEYDYLAGPVLIRVSQDLTPAQAATYDAAAKATPSASTRPSSTPRPSASGSPSSTQKIYAVGHTMKYSDGRSVTVVSFKRGFSTGNEFDTPNAGDEYVQVTYSLVNGSSSEWTEPLFELSLVDSNGQKYQEASVSAGDDTVDSLVAGGHADAVRQVYEVPQGIGVDAVWQPNMFESTVYQTKLV